MSNEQTGFAEFFRASWDPCLRAVVAVVGRPQMAEDQVAEAFARAWVSWRKVSRHPAPRIFLDLDTDIIARQLGIEAGTVRMHLSRGVAALRHELTPTKTMEADQ